MNAASPTLTAQEIADHLRDELRAGRLVPGQRLVEADITRQTGGSRSRVREALRRLEAEGIVTIEEFRGASVRRLGPDEIRQIYETRMVLEGLAAGECARRASPEIKARLRALQDELDRGEANTDHAQFSRLNDTWHKLIIEGSGNTYVAQFLSRLTVPIHRMLFSTFYTMHRIALANADHRVVTAAILDGRTEDAERAMRQHISQGLAALTELDARISG